MIRPVAVTITVSVFAYGWRCCILKAGHYFIISRHLYRTLPRELDRSTTNLLLDCRRVGERDGVERIIDYAGVAIHCTIRDRECAPILRFIEVATGGHGQVTDHAPRQHVYRASALRRDRCPRQPILDNRYLRAVG